MFQKLALKFQKNRVKNFKGLKFEHTQNAMVIRSYKKLKQRDDQCWADYSELCCTYVKEKTQRNLQVLSRPFLTLPYIVCLERPFHTLGRLSFQKYFPVLKHQQFCELCLIAGIPCPLVIPFIGRLPVLKAAHLSFVMWTSVVASEGSICHSNYIIEVMSWLADCAEGLPQWEGNCSHLI